MGFATKKLLFFFDQYFSIRLGEGLYKYDRKRDNFSALRAVGALVSAYLTLRKKKISPPPERQFKNVFYIDTINQRNSILSILQRMDKLQTLVILYEEVNNASLALPGMPPDFRLDARALYRRAITYLPKAILLASGLKSKYKGRIANSHIYINLALFLSAVDMLRSLLSIWRPATLTVVNDHNLFALAAIAAARQERIKTIYIQHASVSPVFPKVITDVALLEGQHSLDVYNKIGNFAKENRLVGIPRLDGFIGGRDSSTISSKLTVGLCLKPFFPPELIANLISALRSCTNVSKIVLRPHPGTSASYQENLRKEYGLPFSNARSENSTQFLQSVDMIVSCESTIILESALMKIPAIYFDDGSFFYPFDLYGFVKNGVAFGMAKAPCELPGIIEGFNADRVEVNFLNCKYYCSTVNTPFANRSSDIFLDFYNTIPEPARGR